MKKLICYYLGILLTLLIMGCGKKTETADTYDLKGKKAFILDSYHAEHIANIPSRSAAIQILEKEGIIVTVFFMDTKNITDEKAIKNIAKEAVRQINRIKPDILLPFDDAASRYVVMPYFKDNAIPVVFNGVNWDAKQYGYPYKNATGQVEIEMVSDLVSTMKKYSSGDKIAMLAGDTETDRESVNFYRKILGIDFSETVFVNNFNSWKRSFLKLQAGNDMLFIRNTAGIQGWNQTDAEGFVHKNIKKMTGSLFAHLEGISVINYAKDDKESGEYSAQTAIKILRGNKVSDIPITQTKRAEIILNMKLAKKLNIIFPMELIEQAKFAGE